MPPAGPIPRRLGRYDIMERLATGGMAEIFLACERGNRGLERLVVIKKILPHLSVQQAFVDMFVQEARIVARLNHPNVVQIYDLAEEENGQVFIVMEYVPGSTLRELTDASEELQRQIPVSAAVGMVIQACKGAHAAHELKDTSNKPLGLVHRDISPHNLMVTSDGNVKLLDFGIAKATEGLEHTATGTLKGKYCYMSPEQCNHLPLDRRSDVFALGIVLWELLAGTRLYKRESELASMQAIVNEDPASITKVRPDVPIEIAEALSRALTRDKDARTPTADEFRRNLVEAAEQNILSINEDEVSKYVKDVLGEDQTARRNAVDSAVERALAKTPSSTGPTRPRELPPLPPEAITAVERKPPPLEQTQAFIKPPSPWRRVVVSLIAAVLGAAAAVGVLLLVVGPDKIVEPPLKGPPLLIAYPPVMDAALQSRELEPLRRYLQRSLRRPFEFPVTKSYDDTADGVLAGRYHFGSFPPYLYLKAHKKDPRVIPLAFKLFEGGYGTDGVLLVTEKVQAQSIKDLGGLTFCFTDVSSLTGYMLPRAALKMAGMDPDVAAAKHHFSGDHLQVLRDLLGGVCDVGATFSGAYLTAGNAGLGVGRLRVLQVTGRSPQDAICAGPSATQAERDAVKAALLRFDPRRDADAGYLGDVQRISGFTAGTDADYTNLRATLQAAGMLN